MSPPVPIRTPLLCATALAAASMLALSGCSVSFEPTPAATSTVESSTQTDVGTPASPGIATPAATPSATTEVDPDAMLTRGQWQAKVGAVISCIGGVAEIVNDVGILELKDDCDTVNVSASGAVVLARNVGALHVIGSNNRVVVATAQTIEVSGAGNDVVWESGSPVIIDIGTLNRVLPVEGN